MSDSGDHTANEKIINKNIAGGPLMNSSANSRKDSCNNLKDIFNNNNNGVRSADRL